MDWQNIRFDWNQARAFLVTAEAGSFSAAARALGLTQPTVGRQVQALEEALGVTLFERVGGGLALTATGLDLAEQVRAMGEAAARVSLTAAGHAEAIDGTVRLTASEVIAACLLPPILGRLRGAHPGVELEIVASNSPSDLRRREADIAIRSFRPTEPDLFARKIKDGAARLYAAPDYLARFGDPPTAAALSRAEFFGFDRSDRLMNALNGLGLALTPRSFPIRTESQLVQWALTCAGVGICIMMEEIGDAEPRVRRALPDLPPIPVPMWLTTHRELHTSRRIRVVFDRLAEELTRL